MAQRTVYSQGPVNIGDIPIYGNTSGSLIEAGGAGNIGNLGGIVITPTANTTNQGFSITQSGGGTPGNFFDYNRITINSDNVATGNPTISAGLGIIMTTGGANVNGPRSGIRSTISLKTAQGTAADVSAIAGQAWAYVNDGGTNTGVGALGTIWGVNPAAHLLSGATNYLSVVGGEVDVGILTGASANSRIGWSIVGQGDLPAAVTDAAIQFGATSKSWEDALILSDRNGLAPLTNTGCVICTDGSAHTIGNGIDLSSYTITGNFLKSAGFSINGAGVIQYAASTAGAGTQTFTNSPCSTLTTERWIPAQITGQTGTWYVPACQ